MNTASVSNRPKARLALLAGMLASSAMAAPQPALFDPDPATWFEVSRKTLDFSGPPLFDLRGLNETMAGEKGRVALRDGHLVLGDGTPVRFYGNATGKFLGSKPLDREKTAAGIDGLIAFMAHNGMNLHRLRARPLFMGPDPLAPEPTRLDALFYTVAQAKKRGIYTLLSPFFPLTNPIAADGLVSGLRQGAKPFGVVYFSPEMQRIYKGQLRVLLTTKNPHTGLSLADDPSLAFIELVNEDNLFFFTMHPNAVPPEQWGEIERQFGGWLARRSGSLEKALAEFDRGETDSAANGRATFLPASAITKASVAKADPGKLRRLRAQAEFMTWLQREFFSAMATYCREELGARCLFVASNWRTADAFLTDALERYSYMATDMLDTHRYYSPKKKGGAAWVVTDKATYIERCALLDPVSAPLQFFDYAGRADAISEVNWTHPNYYRADFLPLLAAYGSLQGLDMMMPFAFGTGGVGPALPWNANEMSTPISVASLPGSVLMFRRGDVARSEPVVKQVLSLPDLYALKGAPAGAQGEDAGRETGDSDGKGGAAQGAFPPLAFFAGRIERGFTDGEGSLETKDLSALIDDRAKVVKSVTGQLAWDYGRGRVLVNAPKAQGAIGFLADTGIAELPALTVEFKNPYAHVLLISLDDAPLSEARRMLLQVVTGERPKTWRSQAAADGRTEITALIPATFAEKEPWMVQRPAGTVELGRAVRVTPLDLAGKASGRSPKITGGRRGSRLDLDGETLLYLIEAE